MKRFNIFSAFLLITQISLSQSFINSIENNHILDPYMDQNMYFSKAGNSQNRYHLYEAPLLNSFLTLYEATGDVLYLDKFIQHSQNVINRRNDNIIALQYHLNPSQYFFPPANNICLPSTPVPAWGTFNSPLPEMVSNGIITFPLIRFAYMIKVKYPFLQGRSLPLTPLTPDASNGFLATNYGEYAELMKIKVHETCHGYFDQKWSSSLAMYLDHNGTEANVNYHTSIGRTEVYLYKLYELEGNNSLRDYYWHKITRIQQMLMNQSLTLFKRENQIVSWKYDGRTEDANPEDVAHALLTFEFADLCNQFGVKDYDTKTQELFPQSLVFDFANTFMQKIVKSPQQYWLSIVGDDNVSHLTTPDPLPAEGSVGRYEQYMNIGRYAFISRLFPEIYTVISDYFYEFALYGPDSSPKYNPGDKQSQTMGIDAVAFIAQQEKDKFFNIKCVARNQGLSGYPPQWKGVTSGKFDGSSTTQAIVSVRNSDGAVEIHEIINNGAYQLQCGKARYVNSQIPKQWVSITSGDFIIKNGRDEIIAFNAGNKKFYLFEQDQINKTNILLIKEFYVGKDFASISSGNLDGIAGSEIIGIDKTDGKMYMYKYSLGTNTFISVPIGNNSIQQYVVSNPSGIAIGNLDKNLSNGLEIVTINNNYGSDNNIKIYRFNSSTMSFSPEVISFTPTTGPSSQWNSVVTGDFNADGTDEIILQRSYDGDFHIMRLDGSNLISIGKEYTSIMGYEVCL